MPKIHPTAVVDASARLADDVEIGPYCVVEADTELGAGTVLRDHVAIRRYTTLGKGNFVDAFTALGGEPQDLKFNPKTVSYVRIGDNNVFREGVSISRATTPGAATTVGSRTYWMLGSHSGHDSHVGDDCILVNGCAVAGHATIGHHVILSAHVCVHQFTWIGDYCMSQGQAATGKHVPPFCTFASTNRVVCLNTVGLRRATSITPQDRLQIKEAFTILYRSGLTTSSAIQQMDAHPEWGPHATAFREFVRKVQNAQRPYNRGLVGLRFRFSGGDDAE